MSPLLLSLLVPAKHLRHERTGLAHGAQPRYHGASLAPCSSTDSSLPARAALKTSSSHQQQQQQQQQQQPRLEPPTDVRADSYNQPTGG